MSGRFPSFVLKSKQSNCDGREKAKLSSNSSASAVSNMSSVNNGSKSRKNSLSPVVKKKKSTSLLTGSRNTSLLSHTSDDLSKALVLKKKNSTRGSTSTIPKNNAKIIKPFAVITDNIVKKDGENLENTSLYEHAATESQMLMHSEGPQEIPEDYFDFYSILAKPKLQDVDEDEKKSAVSHSTENFKIKSLPTAVFAEKDELIIHPHDASSSEPCCRIKPKESEIWGDMRTSSADESTAPPSLTSVAEGEKKERISVLEDSGKQSEETMERDANNNVLETIKNTIYRSFTFFELSRSSTTTASTITSVDEKSGENVRKETKVDYKEGNEVTVFSSSTELDQVNDSGGKINAHPCHKSNIHNSPTALGISLDTNIQDSVLIPLDIKIQLEKAFFLKSSPLSEGSQLDSGSRHLENPFCPETKLENGEVANEAECTSKNETPSLTKIQQAEEKIRDSPSLQLVPNGLARDAIVELESSHSHNPDSISTKQISPTSSYTSAAADEEYFYARYMQDKEEFDSQQTQTQPVPSHDVETDTEGTFESENKREKLMRLAMAVNTGVDITPPQHGRKSMKIRGIMKACRPESINIDGCLSCEDSLSKHSDSNVYKRAIAEKIRYPQTFTQVGADYGFPVDISISRIIGNIETMMWASPEKGGVETEEDISENKGANNGTTCSAGDGICHLMGKAFKILHTGIQYASDLIGIEAQLEPREDWIRYNGYKIRVCGRKLLLESLHVNCDFNIDANGICCRSNHSSIALKPSSSSRKELEQSCEGRRIRIVVRVAGPLVQDTDQVSTPMALKYNVCHSDGKWTFIFGNEENRDNFIEIGCPTGVHPASLAFTVFNGFLLVEAP